MLMLLQEKEHTLPVSKIFFELSGYTVVGSKKTTEERHSLLNAILNPTDG
jgi:hypothetical protein